MTTVGELVRFLESKAPLGTQESYDNSGLLVGSRDALIEGVLLSLDCTEAIVQEAIDKNCNVIVSHHPIIFKGLKSLTGKNYVEKTVIKAIKHDIAIYAIHTNLDNYLFGVNYKIGSLLGLKNLRILAPTSGNLFKIIVFVPLEYVDAVRDAMSQNGAGQIGNYDQCSFSASGTGTFRAMEGAQPFVGKHGELHREQEIRLELVCRKEHLNQVINAMKASHPYEEEAFDVIALHNQDPFQGAGMIGELEQPQNALEYLQFVKRQFNCGVVRHTQIIKEQIKTVAFCGGSGSFLLSQAKTQKADLFITGDYKYHEFFDAEGEIVVADIGHYESEQFTPILLAEWLNQKNITFAVRFAETSTNPVNYL